MLNPESIDVVEDKNHEYSYLRVEERVLLYTLIPVFLTPIGSFRNEKRQRRSIQLLRDIDNLIYPLPQRSKDELHDLFSLMTSSFGRLFIAGIWKNWTDASPESIEAFLHSWQGSGFALLRGAYSALHAIIIPSYYGSPQSWLEISYPGPPKILR